LSDFLDNKLTVAVSGDGAKTQHPLAAWRWNIQDGEKNHLRIPKKMDQKHLQSKGQWSAFGSGRSAPAVVF